VRSAPLDRQNIVIAEALAVVFVALIAIAANASHLKLLLFPPLAALAHEVFTRPRGRWARQPLRLIITPVLTATIGLVVTRYSHFGAFQVLLITVLSVAVIRLLKSAIGPAFSAGVLPLVLGERHWLYPMAILIGLVGLTVVLLVWRRWCFRKDSPSEPLRETSIDGVLESNPHDRTWLFHLMAFVFVVASIGQFTGLRFILFPPLVVMAYEVLGRPELPGWVKRPVLFPLYCFLTGAVGLLSLQVLGVGAISVGVTVAISIPFLRLFQVHMPPALAIALLPYVLREPNWWYPVSVLMGTAILSLWFVVRTRFQAAPQRMLVHESN
jgi:HPP family